MKLDLAKRLKGRTYPWLVAPLAVLMLLSLAFALDGAWPFGGGTISWCDMDQQIVPLLASFKDVLAGQDGFFLNSANGAGMDLWSVFFFYMASPLTFLIAFVPKTELFHFVNLLIALKLAFAGGTAAWCLQKRYPKLDWVWAATLGVLYAMSGYGMLYFQIFMWLDMMALFPLLILSLNALCEKGKMLPYTAVLSAMMVVNYYIGYMVVVFLMLFIGLTLFLRRKESAQGGIALRFVLGSLLAALATAVVWLPSLLQYASSGRVQEGFFASVERSGLLTNFRTTLPTVLCSALALVATAVFLLYGGDARRRQKRLLILVGLTLLPLLIEPINLLWHAGNYMAFPSRYGFIPEFLLVMAAASYLSEEPAPLRKRGDHPVLLMVLLVGVGALLWVLSRYLDAHRNDAAAFYRSLWGDDASFQVCLFLFGTLAIAFVVLLTLWRKGWLSARTLAMVCALLIAGEAFFNVRIYMTMPAYQDPNKANVKDSFFALSDKLEEDELFRVKSQTGLVKANDIGSLGYPSLGHYTSLTQRDYMFMMKRLGYGSDWMDVSNWGGTALTDLLFNVRYEMVSGMATNAVYTSGNYSFVPLKGYLSSGLILPNVNTVAEELPDATRSAIQVWLCERTLGFYGAEDAVLAYQPEGTSSAGCYVLAGQSYTVTIPVEGKRTLYADAFDRAVVSLGGAIDDTFSLSVNGIQVRESYPRNNDSGFHPLGEFQNETVTVTFTAKRNVNVRSMGVVVIDTERLYAAAAQAPTVGFVQDGGTLRGTVTAESGQGCLLSVPFTKELRVTVNGHRVEARKAFGGMTLIPLEDGENVITVSALPVGFGIGLALTLLGLALCVLWALFHKRLRIADGPCRVLAWAVIAAGFVVFLFVYVVPMLAWFSAQI